jgi:hypothetical protein
MLVDKKNKAVYMTGLRNGSTLMDEIKEIVGPNRLFRHEFPEDLIKLISNDRSYKIYMPFRNPMIRFKSGLTVNMYNRCGFDTSIIEANVEYPEYYILYKGMLRYLDNSYANDHNIFHLNYYRPYHLFDTHIDHLLYKPLIYLAYGFDVHMIPLNKFSDHLYKYFPEAISKIYERGRPDSFDKSSPLHEKVWDVYKEIFVDNDPEFYKYKYPEDRTLTFNLWMKPELEIFNLFLENYTNVNLLKTKSRALINHFIKTKQYFKDPYSPKTMEIGTTVPMLEVYNKPNKDLHDYVQSYIGIRDRMTDMHQFT